MGHRFLSHTADLAVELEAPGLPELYAEALVAFTEALADPGTVEERTARRFELTAAAPDLLLVDWLSELLYAFELQDLLFARAEVRVEQREEGWRLQAVAHGEPRDDRHPIKVLIKAVTYHGLEVAQTPDGWRAQVVFDI